MNICLMNLDFRTKQSLRLVLGNHPDGTLAISNQAMADIVIFDLDERDALRSFLGLQKERTELKGIGLTENRSHDTDEVLVLLKPISANRLMDAIREVTGTRPHVQAVRAASSLGVRAGKSKRNTLEATAWISKELEFDPGQYLVGVLMQAAMEAEQTNQITAVRVFGDKVIIADKISKGVWTNLKKGGDGVLRYLGDKTVSRMNRAKTQNAHTFAGFVKTISMRQGYDHLPAATDSINLDVMNFPREDVEGLLDGLSHTHWEVFMWKLGMCTSRGRLPVGIDPVQRLYLRRWPNLTRFGHTDNTMRILGYWSRHPCSVREIAEKLGIPEREVNFIYVAAYAAGLAGPAARKSDKIWEASKVTAHKERGLIASILQRLGRHSVDDAEDIEVAA